VKTRHRLFAALLILSTLLISGLAVAQETAAAAAPAGGGGSLIVKMLTAFGGGVLASLTPCVYPMIMITVSIFGANEAKSRWQGAMMSACFVLGIASLFVPLGIAAALSGSMAGAAAGKPIVAYPLAFLMFALATSMFGAFELALPDSFANKLNSVGGVGYKGAYVLGLVCAPIAAPCTGPALLSILTEIGQTRNVVAGSLLMTSFAFGLGLLFFIVGAFAVSLPKGGAWMLGVKWVFGVGLSYLGLKYIRDCTPAFQAMVSAETLYKMVGVGVIAVGLIFGSIHIAAERRRSPIAHLSKPMKLASIIPAIAGLFMLMSSWGLSPVEASEEATAGTPGAPPIAWTTAEAQARAKAVADKKPVLVDIGATWCGACKELEEHTFPNSKVRAEASRFVAVKIDASDDEAPGLEAMRKKYNVIGLPVVVLIDSTGKEVTRFNEFVPPEKFAEALKKVN
jgi:thioredoxin:protein disulfide reductase